MRSIIPRKELSWLAAAVASALIASIAWIVYKLFFAHRDSVVAQASDFLVRMLAIIVPTDNEVFYLIVSIVRVAPPMLLAIGLFSFLRRPDRPDDRETRCRKCGYILRGIPEPRCSECGERI